MEGDEIGGRRKRHYIRNGQKRRDKGKKRSKVGRGEIRGEGFEEKSSRGGREKSKNEIREMLANQLNSTLALVTQHR